ncbi:MAG: hypothetical protein Harvfovirus8_12 [Harvfovirus sp.]|uniref:Uncharacterized protein n=1 Tax=Harvfovirus sp. TaxID=2487768 RepID=A0A3G5A3R9_9VIRU|nr:MAG: hypothetical protein Harvfovirus8_12 [Harvfovirus sp.]
MGSRPSTPKRQEYSLMIRSLRYPYGDDVTYAFTYDTQETYQSKFIIFSNVQFSAPIKLSNKTIPNCFDYKFVIIHPLTNDFIIFSENVELLYMVRAHLEFRIDGEKYSKLIVFEDDPKYDITPFNEVVDTIKFAPGGPREKELKKDFDAKINDPKYKENEGL